MAQAMAMCRKKLGIKATETDGSGASKVAVFYLFLNVYISQYIYMYKSVCIWYIFLYAQTQHMCIYVYTLHSWLERYDRTDIWYVSLAEYMCFLHFITLFYQGFPTNKASGQLFLKSWTSRVYMYTHDIHTCVFIGTVWDWKLPTKVMLMEVANRRPQRPREIIPRHRICPSPLGWTRTTREFLTASTCCKLKS